MRQFSRAAISKQYAENIPQTFVFFWGPGEAELPKACFNQWHPAKFMHNNHKFANAEQAMMAEKAFLFKDFGTLGEILQCESPRAVKALGRQVQWYVDDEWAAIRLQAVVEVNYEKFSQNPEMLEHLLATGNSILVEASPVDKIWGIGMDDRNIDCTNPYRWLGQNLLGEALMIVREQLRQEEDDDV